MDAIKTVNLTKKYKNLTAVDGLNLTVKQGELFSLLGVNGAGKTTTIKMLSCLMPPTGGDAFLNGNSILSDTAKVKGIIGISPQETAVAPNLSVRENLELMCGIYGFTKEHSSKKIAELSDSLGLHDILKRRAGKLSGGQQRRLSIAMALVHEPQILFLDEPTLGLDVLARSDLWEVIRSLKGKITIILTTHYMEEAESLSDRIGIMRAGSFLALGTADELKKMVGTDKFEDAFVTIIKGADKNHSPLEGGKK
ncbi:MAG: ATP-binding cassette domain-containing protein [Lachnospiraceae bacterium]|nr:ATP-binding cassette domain-containing protein [Lachnospiraceae bacterium]